MRDIPALYDTTMGDNDAVSVCGRAAIHHIFQSGGLSSECCMRQINEPSRRAKEQKWRCYRTPTLSAIDGKVNYDV